MDIKYILGVLVVILLISNIFFINEMQFSNKSDKAIIGEKSFELPDNYSFNKLEISNDSNTLLIFKSTNSTLDSAISNYVDKNSGNFTISVSDFDSKFPCKKTVATNRGNDSIIKYWFEIDNDLYYIQVVSNNGTNFDDIATNMINSIS